MQVYLVDGTYELFRHYYALPSSRDAEGKEIAAVRGVIASLLSLIKEGATHIAVATDHVIESFRNQLWQGYKTGEGVDPELLAQFPVLEEAVAALGIVLWPMVEYEADDALASGAKLAAGDKRVDKVFICTPDKDLGQCVSGHRVVQIIRRTGEILDEPGIIAKFGVPPGSIPDYLALVGDSADGYPGIKGWGAKSSAAVLGKFRHLEAIPKNCIEWGIKVPGAIRLATVLQDNREQAKLFRTLATLRTDIPLFKSVEELRWSGPTAAFEAVGARLAGKNRRNTLMETAESMRPRKRASV